MSKFLFIAGAPKCATTSIHKLLSRNKFIDAGNILEPKYFSLKFRNLNTNAPGDQFIEKSKPKSFADYISNWKKNDENIKYYIDGSANYLFYHQSFYEIYKTFPNSKIIIIIRNPLERAKSAYNMLIRDGREWLDFNKAILRDYNDETFNFESIWKYYQQSKYLNGLLQMRNILKIILEYLYLNKL